MGNYHLTDMALKMYCPGNEAIVDTAGLPSIMVWIPAFKNSDVLNGGDDSIHPAFIVNEQQIPGFWYSKYENIVYNDKAYSLPGENPQSSVQFDKAREYCEAKGYGWHLSTAAEWAAIALLCKKNGSLPYGNNLNGKDYREQSYKAIPVSYLEDGTTAKVSTGTGPITWSHDNTMSGIWDMNGNVWEWQGGMRVVWGELQILENNDAADPDNPQNTTSTCWKAINAATGSLVAPESNTTDAAGKTSGNTVRLDYINGAWTYSTTISSAVNNYRGCAFGKVTCAASIGAATKVLLRSLALLPDDGAAEDEYDGNMMYWNNATSERCVDRGGGRNSGMGSGLFYVDGSYGRTPNDTSFGFRASYIPNI